MSLSRERPMVTRSLARGNRSRDPSPVSMEISAMGAEAPILYPLRGTLREGGAAGSVGGGRDGWPPPLDREIALAHADFGVLALAEPDLDLAPGPVRRTFWRVGQQVVVVQLVRDAVEDLDQLADLVGKEEGPAGLLRDLAQEPARAAREQARLPA